LPSAKPDAARQFAELNETAASTSASGALSDEGLTNRPSSNE
jgi:hypothetical protein